MDTRLSALMTEYNNARNAFSDKDRTDRALGLLMSGMAELKWLEYGTTANYCGCMDDHSRGRICKHRRSFMINERIHHPKNGICHHVSLRGDWDDLFEPINICNDCGRVFRKTDV